MKTVKEIKDEIKRLKGEAQNLKTADEINAVADQLETLNAELRIAEMAEAEARENAEKSAPAKPEKATKQEMYNKALAEFVRSKGKVGMDVQNTLQSGAGADGGHLVTVVDDTSVINLREANDALQNIVRVVKITKPEGKKTVQKRHGNGTNFTQVGEGDPITTGGTPKFYKMEYSAKKYAAIYDITDEEFSDSDENVISIMNEWIGNDSRCNRNNLILGALDLLPKTAITGLDDIKTVLNKTLRKASLRFSTVITNQSGYNWLDQLKDADGKPILQPDPKDADRYLLKGKKVDVYDDEILPNHNDGVNDFAPVIIGDMDNVVLFDREEVRVRITDVGSDAFDKDKILMRAIEREDVQLLCDTVDELARDIVYGRINLGA